MINLEKELIYFIKERHAVYMRRFLEQPRPWTKDPLLQMYRFCNIYRELDAVTVWIAKNWREKHKDDKDVWFAMCVARWINLPETLDDLGYPKTWNPEKFRATMERRKRNHQKLVNGAYMITTHGDKQPLPEFLTGLFTTLWSRRAELRPRAGDTLKSFTERLASVHHFGTFMAAQVTADVKYTTCLADATDWWTWAASGPGSRRGLNRVLGRPLNAPWSEEEWLFELQKLHATVNKVIEKLGYPRLHAQDLQSCNCEIDKYLRAKNGEGRPKSRYPGGGCVEESSCRRNTKR